VTLYGRIACSLFLKRYDSTSCLSSLRSIRPRTQSSKCLVYKLKLMSLCRSVVPVVCIRMICSQVFSFHDRWVPVTTAWRVLGLRMEERPTISMVYANVFNRQSGTADKGWHLALRLGEVLITSHRKSWACYETLIITIIIFINCKWVDTRWQW
jgi:hypothetical protein